jgi:hypothetical protein
MQRTRTSRHPTILKTLSASTDKKKMSTTRKLTSKEIENIKEKTALAMKEEEKKAILHAQAQAPSVAFDINEIVNAADIKHRTSTATKSMNKQSTLQNNQGDAPLCISYATSRAMVNIIFPEDTFYYLTPDDRLKIMKRIIPYLGLPPDIEINFDGKLIPEFLNKLVFELNQILKNKITNIGIHGTTVQGGLPETAVPILNELLSTQNARSDNQCTSPLWNGIGDCFYFKNYIVVYVILPKKSSDYLYGLRHDSTDKIINNLKLIALSNQMYDITYDEERGLYSTKFPRDKRKMVTVGHALVIKGYHLDPATRLITHLLVRNSWGDCEHPSIGGYWVPIEFFNKNTYAAFRFV